MKICLKAITGIPQAISLAVCLTFLTNCSNLQIFYFISEEYIFERADDYLNLSEQQRSGAKKQVSALIRWHRKNMLPKYADFFLEQANATDKNLWSESSFTVEFEKFRTLLNVTVEGAVPFIAELFVDQLSPSQINHLETRMTENHVKRRSELLKENLNERVERRAKNISRFTGPLNEDQLSIIRSYTKRDRNYTTRWVHNRGQRQKALVEFLRTAPSHSQIASFIYRILLKAHEITDPDYQAISEQRWKTIKSMYFKVAKSLTPTQRKQLSSSLRVYASEMTRLSRS